MKLVALAFMLTVSVAFAADPKVPAVVGIWRVDMVDATTTTDAPVTVTTTDAPVTVTTTVATPEVTNLPDTIVENSDSGVDAPKNHPRFPQVTLHRNKRADEMDHRNVFICTGTLINENYVLTTEECAKKATSDMGTVVSAGKETASPETPPTNLFDVDTKTISMKTPLALLQVKQDIVSKTLRWTEATTAENTTCQFVYWKEEEKMNIVQKSIEMTTVACKESVKERICVKSTPKLPAPREEPPKPTICEGGLEGGVLVCSDKVVAMYGINSVPTCHEDVTNIELYEVFAMNDWLTTTTAGASGVTLSALIGLLAAAVCSLLH